MRTCLKKIGILAVAILLAAVFTTGCKTEVSDETFTVEMKAGEHGTVSANPASGKVEKGTVITFTATPATDYKVDTWTITGGSFEEGTGTDGSPTAKVKISADTKVSVSFIRAIYAIVPFGTNGVSLDNHLKNTSPYTDGIYYIKVTGLTAADLRGKFPSAKPGALGTILTDNPTKKVALELEKITGLTDMSCCFYECKSLTQAPVIPAGVTDMSYCFYGCESLTQAPVIPAGVIDMGSCFESCTNLTQAPVIPAGVTNMYDCFSGCKSLTQAPVIPAGVTDMSWCFSGCTSLTQGPVIPSSVTNMKNCFSGCKNLTQAPEIPNSVTNMERCFSGCENITAVTLKCNYVADNFDSAFSGCEKLTAYSIKVPAAQLQTYRNNAAIIGAQQNWFVAGD